MHALWAVRNRLGCADKWRSSAAKGIRWFTEDDTREGISTVESSDICRKKCGDVMRWPPHHGTLKPRDTYVGMHLSTAQQSMLHLHIASSKIVMPAVWHYFIAVLNEMGH